MGRKEAHLEGRRAESIVVLGVDPGTRRAGIAVLSEGGKLRLRRAVSLNGTDPNRRLLGLYEAVAAALDRSRAAVLAIENPSHPRNARTAHLLGRAVGVCVLAAVERDLIVLEYRPAQVRGMVDTVRRRWPSSARWSEDELVAAAAALLGLMEPIECVGRTCVPSPRREERKTAR